MKNHSCINFTCLESNNRIRPPPVSGVYGGKFSRAEASLLPQSLAKPLGSPHPGKVYGSAGDFSRFIKVETTYSWYRKSWKKNRTHSYHLIGANEGCRACVFKNPVLVLVCGVTLSTRYLTVGQFSIRITAFRVSILLLYGLLFQQPQRLLHTQEYSYSDSGGYRKVGVVGIPRTLGSSSRMNRGNIIGR